MEFSQEVSVMALYPEKIYNAIGYFRLSKDDGGKRESDSISNQRKLIREYAATHNDVVIVRKSAMMAIPGRTLIAPAFVLSWMRSRPERPIV